MVREARPTRDEPYIRALEVRSTTRCLKANQPPLDALSATGVPTVWLNLLSYMEANGLTFKSLKTVCIGGSAAPRSMIDAFEKK